MHGKGRYKRASGSIYEGDWVDGERHGHGQSNWNEGTIYIGEWKYN